MKPAGAGPTVSGRFRSVQRSARSVAGELLDGRGNPAPDVSAVVIAAGRKLVGTRGALFERLFAVAFQHQVGGAPDVDLGYHVGKMYAAISKRLIGDISYRVSTRRVGALSAEASSFYLSVNRYYDGARNVFCL
jgi:hypothetical protein